MALSFAPDRFTGPAPEPTPESIAKLDKIIEYCEGIIARYSEPFEPLWNLKVSQRAAARFFETRVGKGGDIIITGFNFHEIMAGEDIAITIPAYIGGRPVSTLADVDFDRLGMQMRSRLDAIPARTLVKAFVLPKTMKLVGRGVLNSLAPRHTYVSASVEELDTTGLATTISYLSPKASIVDARPPDRMVTTDHSLPKLPVEGADFFVHPENTTYRALDGSLYTHDLSRLKFLALPYPEFVELPEGLHDIDKTAYVYGHTRALTLHVPDSLEDASFSPSSNCLWVCSHETEFFRTAQERGWMVATVRHGREGAFAYDILDNGTARIIRVIGSPQHLVIPAEIAGCQVTSLGNNALPQSVASLVLPETLVEICGHMTCVNLTSMTLPTALRRIGPKAFSAHKLAKTLAIPAECTEIGRGSFGSGTLYFAAVGASVLLDPPFASACFAQGTPPFDFGAYDQQLSVYSNRPQRLRATLERLTSPFGLSDAARAEFESFLMRHMTEAIEFVGRTGNLSVLNLLLDAYSWDAASLDRFAAQMNTAGQTECTIAIMNRRHELFGHGNAPSTTSRFSL